MKNDLCRTAQLDIVTRLYEQRPAHAGPAYTVAVIAVLGAIEEHCQERDRWSAPGTTWAEAKQGQRLGDMIALLRQKCGLNP